MFKAPRLIKYHLTTQTFTPTTIVKGLFAQVEGEISLEQQNIIDEAILAMIEQPVTATATSRKDGQQTAQECLHINSLWNEQELKEGLQEIRGSGLSEDVGRYIGFGRKEFTKEKNKVYGLAKLLFPSSEQCYGFNPEAKILCEHSSAIDNFEIATLKTIYQQMKNKDGEAGTLLKEALGAFEEKIGDDSTTFNPQEFRDQIVALRQYYQSNSIKSDNKRIAIPYRYLVPLNITFNRSLQNLSSYYTDIGFTRILLYIILIVTLPYALLKRNKKLIVLSLTTLI